MHQNRKRGFALSLFVLLTFCALFGNGNVAAATDSTASNLEQARFQSDASADQYASTEPTVKDLMQCEQKISDLYSALQSIPPSPSAYVQAYLQALATRSGFLARAYLAPKIQDSIPSGTIGSSKWMSKWTISRPYATKISGSRAFVFHIASSSMFGPIFTGCLTVQSKNPDSSEPPYLITKQSISFAKGWGGWK